MLVICNGAAKSGSTWLYNILVNILDCSWPDQQFLTGANQKHPTIREDFFEQFLRSGAHCNKTLISKNHLGKPWHRELLLGDQDVFIVCMTRDARDVIVASYYDYQNRHDYKKSFQSFYWEIGRLQIKELADYQAVWAKPQKQIFMTTFEALKNNFSDEIFRLGHFLGRELSELQIDNIEQATSLQSLRDNYADSDQHSATKNSFFRKGEIGDWRNHFDRRIEADFEHVSQTGIGPFDRHVLRHKLQQRIQRYFKQIRFQT